MLLFIFRSPHKKRTETQNSVVLSSTLLLLLPLDEQQRKRNFLFFSFVSSCLTLPPHLPKHCQNPKPNATHTPSWWKYQGSHALQTAPYWPPYLAPWQGRVASLPIRHNRTGQGRSHSPYPYKYHQKRTEEGREKKNLARDEKNEKKTREYREIKWRKTKGNKTEKRGGWCLCTGKKKNRSNCHHFLIANLHQPPQRCRQQHREYQRTKGEEQQNRGKDKR